MDLTQVEGLKDLIEAETEVQRKMAVRAAGVGEILDMPTAYTLNADMRRDRVLCVVNLKTFGTR
jgi:hypothetical protein